MKSRIIALLIFCFAMLFILTGCGCKHENTSVQNTVECTCTTDGYSGDIYCNDCQKIVERGSTIKAPGHIETHMAEVSATCEEDGYTGDYVCSVCEEILTCGEAIPALGHTYKSMNDAVEATCQTEGYSGTQICSICEYELTGEIIDKKDHDYSDYYCTFCGWKKPGLYIDNQLIMDWQELKNKGYVVATDETAHYPCNVDRVVGDFSDGCLVIGEGIYTIGTWGGKGIKDANISEVWLPSTLQSTYVYLGESVKRLVMFSKVDEISEGSFRDSSCESVFLPDTISVIGQGAFQGMENLSDINLPKDLKIIGNYAFDSCSSLTDIELPFGITRICQGAFNKTGIRCISIPESVTEIQGCFNSCKNLESVDMSACSSITELGFTWNLGLDGCTSLRRIIFPPNIKTINCGIFGRYNKVNLDDLAFPEGFVGFDGVLGETSFKKIWWPVSLTDGTCFKNCNIEEIYYYGTETEWKMVGGNNLFPNAIITFNNKYPYSN